MFQEIALDKNTVLKNFSDPDLTVKINKNILAAILHNLIDNAAKYTDHGTIMITTEAREHHIEIAISDTGNGMSQTQIEYYTEVFNSMGNENFTFKNYGLGLHMVIQLVKKLDAEISFQENIPKGTVVKVIITAKQKSS